MSDYRFGSDYKLSIFPKNAMDCWGEIDMNKVEAVEIEWVDFIRKPDDKSRWHQLFGSPERVARTLHHNGSLICSECLIRDGCAKTPENSDCLILHYDALLEWIRSES